MKQQQKPENNFEQNAVKTLTVYTVTVQDFIAGSLLDDSSEQWALSPPAHVFRVI